MEADALKFIRLSQALSSSVTRKLAKLILKEDNTPMYHNLIHRKAGGSKLAISKALHILVDDYGILENGYELILAKEPNPHERKISVLMFKMKQDYFEILQRYSEELLSEKP